ncbi:hypothetical protein SAMN06272789_7120 [Streptomyces sp. 1331.2]|nr:hypothetical protein SAMN06272789_7120 [Streptomyces sp. 1331.2]
MPVPGEQRAAAGRRGKDELYSDANPPYSPLKLGSAEDDESGSELPLGASIPVRMNA